ncbi:MAG: preprotein translocase subunit YajC [Acidimicrobiia bacterium]
MKSFPLLPLTLTALLFYLLAVRPQKRLAASRRALIESLLIGDEVVTAGGIFGRIERLDDRALQLEVAPGISIRVDRGAIVRKVTETEVPE